MKELSDLPSGEERQTGLEKEMLGSPRWAVELVMIAMLRVAALHVVTSHPKPIEFSSSSHPLSHCCVVGNQQPPSLHCVKL